MGDSELPLHLLLPLAASALFVVGLMLIKKAGSYGVGPWTVTFVANLWAAFVFSTLLLMGGPGQPLSQLWQPTVIGVLYILGQVFTFVALSRGDVSVATPVFSVKVLLVAVLVTVIAPEQLPAGVWVAAALATATHFRIAPRVRSASARRPAACSRARRCPGTWVTSASPRRTSKSFVWIWNATCC